MVLPHPRPADQRWAPRWGSEAGPSLWPQSDLEVLERLTAVHTGVRTRAALCASPPSKSPNPYLTMGLAISAVERH